VAYLLAIGSAVLYGAADFTGGLTTRRASTIPVVLLSQAAGLVLLALILPLLPHASPSQADLLWGAAAGLTVESASRCCITALAIGRMAVVAPTNRCLCGRHPGGGLVLLGSGRRRSRFAGIALGIVSIVLVSQQPQPEATASPRGRQSGVGIALASGIAIGFFLLSFAQTDPMPACGRSSSHAWFR